MLVAAAVGRLPGVGKLTEEELKNLPLQAFEVLCGF